MGEEREEEEATVDPNLCQSCGAKHLIQVSAKCSDTFGWKSVRVRRWNHGYVPRESNLGGGDYVEFRLCMDCGTVQGKWPARIEE